MTQLCTAQEFLFTAFIATRPSRFSIEKLVFSECNTEKLGTRLCVIGASLSKQAPCAWSVQQRFCVQVYNYTRNMQNMFGASTGKLVVVVVFFVND